MPDPRYTSRSGVQNRNAKLDDVRVREILDRLADGDTTRAIAKDYGVSHEIISRIGRGRAWAHVTSRKAW